LLENEGSLLGRTEGQPTGTVGGSRTLAGLSSSPAHINPKTGFCPLDFFGCPSLFLAARFTRPAATSLPQSNPRTLASTDGSVTPYSSGVCSSGSQLPTKALGRRNAVSAVLDIVGTALRGQAAKSNRDGGASSAGKRV
jgi:hypothetical protein